METGGTLELLTDPADFFMLEARLFADDRFEENGLDLEEELPLFDDGIVFARDRAKLGTHRRAEMPVIEEEDIGDLRTFLLGIGAGFTVSTLLASNAKPTQFQIYADKSIKGTAKSGRSRTIEFLKSHHLVTDSNNEILDGHHRWLTACTIDPELELPQLRIDLPLIELLPDLLKFSDARHERNQ